ncbi:MAG: hypothetical protein R3F45_03605 [Gammaproteobacteria bacterium]
MTLDSSRLFVVASLWVHAEPVAQFDAYELKALSIARRHLGRLEQAIRVATNDPGAPFEIHVLSFPTESHFAAFRADAEMTALSGERDSAIYRTEVTLGRNVPAYAARHLAESQP